MLFYAHIAAYALVGLAVSPRVFAAPTRGGSEDLYGHDGLSPIARDAAPAGKRATENTPEGLFLRAPSHAHAGRSEVFTRPTSTTVVVLPSSSQVDPDLAASDPSDDACGSASVGDDAAAIFPNLSLGLNTYPSRTFQKRQNGSCASSARTT